MSHPGNDAITIDTIIHAPIEAVWEAWTNPAIILNWFGSDPGGTGVKARMDVHPGGSFEITFRDSDETQHTCYGVYTVVEVFSQLAFTWEWKSEPGVESLVTVLLVSDGNQTRMHFSHAHLGAASKHNYLSGWQSTFVKLENMLKGLA